MAALPQLPAVQETSDDASKDAVFENILETLQSNNSLLDEIEDNTESDETASEKRNKRVTEENTDKPGAFSKAIGGLGAGVKGVGGILNKANPFQEGGLGPKMSILLISGVLFAISKFGDKLIKPLAEVLEAFDSEGGVLEKLKNTELFKGIAATFEKIGADIKKQFETISTDIQTAFDDSTATFKQMGETIKTMGDDIGKLLESVTLVGGYVKSAYDTIMGYINQFDTKGGGPRNEFADGKLDSFEMKNLRLDVEKKIFDFIGNLVDNVLSALYTFLGATVLLAYLKGRAFKFGKGEDGDKNKNNKTSNNKDKFKSKSSLVRNLAKSLVVGTSAFSGSSVGNTNRVSKIASLKPGEAINKAGSIYNTKTGRIVTPATSFTHLSKYPRLLMAAKRIPILTPLLTGGLALETMNDDTLSKDAKAIKLGGIIGGGLGAGGFGAIGGMLGSLFPVPGVGTIAGALTGSIGGYFFGEKVGEMLMSFLMGKDRDPIDIGSMNTSTLGSMMDGPPGTPEAFKPKSSSGNMEIRNASSLGSTASQLDSTLMNKNSDLAIAAYQANLQSKSALPFDRRLSQNHRDAKGAEVVVMPLIVDKSEIKTFNSNYSSSLGSNNNYSTVRVLGLEGLF